MMPKHLTGRQKQIYRAIKDFTAEHHRSPSERELAALCDIAYVSVVSYNLLVLQSKGFIKLEPRLSRTIHIIRSLEEEI